MLHVVRILKQLEWALHAMDLAYHVEGGGKGKERVGLWALSRVWAGSLPLIWSVGLD